MNARFIFNRFPVMPRFCAVLDRGVAKPKPIAPFHLSRLVRAALLADSMTLGEWARAMKVSRTQASMALSGYRRDARSQMIRAELVKLIQGEPTR